MTDPKQLFSRPTLPTSAVSPDSAQAPVLSAPSVESKALPLDWLLAPKAGTLAERVLARLIQCEAHEPDVSLRDDWRQSFITVALALAGSPIPFIEASYRMYGLHPDKVYPAILARRTAMLGATGEVAPSEHPQTSPAPYSPKKSVPSVKEPAA